VIDCFYFIEKNMEVCEMMLDVVVVKDKRVVSEDDVREEVEFIWVYDEKRIGVRKLICVSDVIVKG
jgi:hypothetical protein